MHTRKAPLTRRASLSEARAERVVRGASARARTDARKRVARLLARTDPVRCRARGVMDPCGRGAGRGPGAGQGRGPVGRCAREAWSSCAQGRGARCSAHLVLDYVGQRRIAWGAAGRGARGMRRAGCLLRRKGVRRHGTVLKHWLSQMRKRMKNDRGDSMLNFTLPGTRASPGRLARCRSFLRARGRREDNQKGVPGPLMDSIKCYGSAVRCLRAHSNSNVIHMHFVHIRTILHLRK